MNIFQKLFKNKKERNYFSIEFYPITKRYYPKYKNHYIGLQSSTGIFILKEDYLFAFAEFGRTELEADKIIEKFKEQQLKVNVVTINK